MNALNFQRAKPVYSKNIQEYEKIFLATLFRLANNHNQPFVHNACANLNFSQQKKFVKYLMNTIIQKNGRTNQTNKIACKNFRKFLNRELCIKKSAKIHKCVFYWKNLQKFCFNQR